MLNDLPNCTETNITARSVPIEIQDVPKKCPMKLKINTKYIPSFFIKQEFIWCVSLISSPSKPLYFMTIDHLLTEIWSI